MLICCVVVASPSTPPLCSYRICSLWDESFSRLQIEELGAFKKVSNSPQNRQFRAGLSFPAGVFLFTAIGYWYQGILAEKGYFKRKFSLGVTVMKTSYRDAKLQKNYVMRLFCVVISFLSISWHNNKLTKWSSVTINEEKSWKRLSTLIRDNWHWDFLVNTYETFVNNFNWWCFLFGSLYYVDWKTEQKPKGM